ncbi:MAG: Hsp20/alpha crystallin family protein [Flavobacteriaceae bacterium]|nr:Hsp20/alpha crystallin family protein [Flavobacteriaceae bacterium]
MSLIKRNQASPSTSLWRPMDSWLPSIFEDLFNEGRLADVSNFGSTLPAVNIKETDDDFQVEVAVPGKKKEDFTIELDQNVLTISSEDKNEKEQTSKDGRYTRKEFNYSSFKRAFTLPDTVEQDKIEAVYNHGVLNISVPKREESKQKPKRMIAVS